MDATSHIVIIRHIERRHTLAGYYSSSFKFPPATAIYQTKKGALQRRCKSLSSLKVDDKLALSVESSDKNGETELKGNHPHIDYTSEQASTSRNNVEDASGFHNTGIPHTHEIGIAEAGLLSLRQLRQANIQLLLPNALLEDDRWLDLDFDLPDDDDSLQGEPTPPTFEKGPMQEGDCEICYSTVEDNSRWCCNKLVCNSCMVEFLTVGIREAKVHFTCPTGECSKPVSKDEILCRIQDNEIIEKYRRFIVNANLEPNKKTCPHCSLITEMEEKPRNKFGHTIICVECGFHWCFECHSPNHEGLRCKENVKGLKALRAWAKENFHGQRNARKCPKCKLLIQRTSGCDHMTCSQCKTDFCYKCGERHMSSRLFGHHYGKLSVFGCPHNFMNGRKKHLRRFVRGSVFTAKLTGATVGSAVVVGLLPVALVAALFAGPVVGFVRLHRYRKQKRMQKLMLSFRNAERPVIVDEDPFLRQLQRQGLEPRRDMSFPNRKVVRVLDMKEIDDIMVEEDDRSVSNSSLNTLGETTDNPAFVTVEVSACADEISDPKIDGGEIIEVSEVTHL